MILVVLFVSTVQLQSLIDTHKKILFKWQFILSAQLIINMLTDLQFFLNIQNPFYW